MPVQLSVVVCTLDRAALLRRCLESLAAAPPAPEFHVLVVDNDPRAGGNPDTVRAVADLNGPRRFTHVGAPGPNISLARNAGIEAATGEWVAFIDDDMTVPPGWAAAVTEQMAAGADALVGEVRAHDEAGRRLQPLRDLGHADGARIRLSIYGHYRGVGAGNAAFRRAVLLEEGLRFDPAWGRTGGEDTEFFARFRSPDRRVVYSRRAYTDEVVPAHRLTAAYQAARAYRTSQIFVRATVRHSRAPALTGPMHRAIGALQLARARLKGDADARALATASALGKLAYTRIAIPERYS